MKLMTLYENMITEKTFTLDQDVELIYKAGKFQEFFDEYNSGLHPYHHQVMFGKDVEFKVLTSDMLETPDAVAANDINPITIYCGIYRNSYYQPDEKSINLSIPPSALKFFYRGDKDIKDMPQHKRKAVINILTPRYMKSVIYHELAHWVSDSLHNRHLDKIVKYSTTHGGKFMNLGKDDRNETYYEIDAQIHAIKYLYNKRKNKWDSYELIDLFNMIPDLHSIFTSIVDNNGQDVANRWQRALMTRMNREGLLGKNMRKFVKIQDLQPLSRPYRWKRAE